MRIAVIGGDNVVGAELMNKLVHRGHDVPTTLQDAEVSSATVKRIVEAIAGCEVVIDATAASACDSAAALELLHGLRGNVTRAESIVRAKHHVTLSAVGTDRLLGSGYFRAQMAQEELVQRSLIPHTILRATQTFDFMDRILRSVVHEPTVRVPPALCQPVASDEIAAALADIATAAPLNDVVEIAGPELFQLDEFLRRLMRVNGDSRRIVADPEARFFGAALSRDTLIPDDGAILGVTRLEDWLRYAAPKPGEDTPSSTRYRGADSKGRGDQMSHVYP